MEGIFDLTPVIFLIICGLLIRMAPDYFMLACVPSLSFSFFKSGLKNKVCFTSKFEDIYQSREIMTSNLLLEFLLSALKNEELASISISKWATINMCSRSMHTMESTMVAKSRTCV